MHLLLCVETVDAVNAPVVHDVAFELKLTLILTIEMEDDEAIKSNFLLCDGGNG